MNLPSLRDNPVMYLGLLVTIEQAIAQGTVHLTNVVPESWIPYVVAWASLLAFIGTAIMTTLSAPGVLKPATVAKVGAIILALCVLAPGEVRAQPKKPIGGPIGQVLDKIQGEPTPAPGASSVDRAIGGNSQLAKLLAKPFTDLANFINSDALAAAQLAIAIPDLQDGTGQQCWLAMSQFTAVLKAHPIPLTLDAMTDLEALRLLAMAANNVCRNAACTQVFADVANGVQQVAPINLGIPIPSLNSLCSKVPVVTPAPPVAMPPAPAPAPASQP